MKYLYFFRTEKPFEQDSKTHYRAHLIVLPGNEEGKMYEQGSVHLCGYSNESNDDAVLKIIKNLFERLDINDISKVEN